MFIPSTKIADYWGPSKKHLLSDINFLNRLRNYPIDDVDPNVVARVMPYISNPEFDDATIRRASKAAAGMCKWVHAVVTYVLLLPLSFSPLLSSPLYLSLSLYLFI